MSRYIDADELIKIGLQDGAYEYVSVDEIANFPTADVIPIEWIKEQKDKCFPYSVTALALNGLLAEWERREDEQIH